MPETAIIIQNVFPIDKQAFGKTNNFGPEILLMAQGNYSEKISVNYNLGTKWENLDENPFLTYKLTFSYLLNENWFLYSDYFGHFHTDELSEKKCRYWHNVSAFKRFNARFF